MINNSHKNKINGFTLVELLVVITILGILATIGLVAFSSSQARGRDAQRKSDLKQIATALELFYSDYGKYPVSRGGEIKACPYSSTDSTSTGVCVWGGTTPFEDIDANKNPKTIYFRVLPKDPAKDTSYYYVSDTTLQKFQVFAHLENTQDPQLISTTYMCGAKSCNFGATSANTTATDVLQITTP
jgi:prepilin-type N-terminal cleavage/methylation domain-containing protein